MLWRITERVVRSTVPGFPLGDRTETLSSPGRTGRLSEFGKTQQYTGYLHGISARVTESKGESLALQGGDEADGEYSFTAVMQYCHPIVLIRYNKY